MIEVRNLVKRYGDYLAVDHLNFSVQKGQIYGFLGPNGAGKSTTMNIMTGYLGATEGEVVINGHNILEEPCKAKKCIGYLPEVSPLYLDMTVSEYLTFASELKGLKKKERKAAIEDVIELTKLGDVEKRLIKNLSKGYRQRVGLAQAVLGMPEIIILDEPTVGLDPKQIIEIRDLMKELGKNHTVILSSHILSEVSAICDHILIIAGGKLAASDTPENLEQLFTGANTLNMQIKGEKEKISSILSEFEEIMSIMIKESKEEGCFDIEIKTAKETDLREALFFRFAEEKYPILMIKASHVSLEDVFLELTDSQKREPEESRKRKKRNLISWKKFDSKEEGKIVREDGAPSNLESEGKGEKTDELNL